MKVTPCRALLWVHQGAHPSRCSPHPRGVGHGCPQPPVKRPQPPGIGGRARAGPGHSLPLLEPALARDGHAEQQARGRLPARDPCAQICPVWDRWVFLAHLPAGFKVKGTHACALLSRGHMKAPQPQELCRAPARTVALKMDPCVPCYGQHPLHSEHPQVPIHSGTPAKQAGQALWGAEQQTLLNAATETCSRSLSLSVSGQLAPSGPIGGSGTVGGQVLDADPLLLPLAALRPWVEVTSWACPPSA